MAGVGRGVPRPSVVKVAGVAVEVGVSVRVVVVPLGVLAMGVTEGAAGEAGVPPGVLVAGVTEDIVSDPLGVPVTEAVS